MRGASLGAKAPYDSPLPTIISLLRQLGRDEETAPRDRLRHTVIGIVGGVVAFIFLLLVKLPIVIEVVTGAQGAQAEHRFGAC